MALCIIWRKKEEEEEDGSAGGLFIYLSYYGLLIFFDCAFFSTEIC